MAKTMKVRLLCAVTHGSKGGRKDYAPGDVVALPPDLADELLEQGAAEPADRILKPVDTLEDPATSPQAQLGSLLDGKARKDTTPESGTDSGGADAGADSGAGCGGDDAAGDTPEA